MRRSFYDTAVPPIKTTIVALGLALAACAPATRASPPQPNPAPTAEQWVEQTLRALTLREKVGQMVMFWTGGEYLSSDSPEFDRLREQVQKHGAGGLIISIGLPHSYAAKLNALQRLAKVPLLVATDMETGPGMRLAGAYTLPHLLPQGGGTVMPNAMAFGATRSDSLARAAGRVTAREARAVGVHVTFGPVLDVNSNPLNPIINVRSFGEDPALVARLGAAFVAGAQAGGLLTAGKHFPGHGDTEVDSHIGLPAIAADRARLDTLELVPFRAVIQAGAEALLTAHIAVVGVEGPNAPPASLSPRMSTRLLREELGFEGLVFTDALNMGAVTRRYGINQAAVEAVIAGADILLQPIDPGAAIDTVMEAVRAGRITEERIDASVRRILRAKARAGLHRQREVDPAAVERVVGVREHTDLAQQVAERSITLARDRTGLVPLASTARRVLVLTFADGSDLLAGRAFTSALAGEGRRVDAVRLDERTSPAEYAALLARADSADVVIATAYVVPREYRGTVAAAAGFPEFVQALATARKPVVAVSFGSPYLLGSFAAVPAYLLAWGGADVSQRAAARALLGQSPITGRLPVSIPPFHRFGEGLDRPTRAITVSQ